MGGLVLNKTFENKIVCSVWPHFQKAAPRISKIESKDFILITPTNIGQSLKPGTVSESACPKDSETVTGC